MEIRQPRIETERLILEPFKSTDADDVFSYASDAEVARYTLWNHHKSIHDSEQFLNWVKNSTSTVRGELFFVFAIRLKSTGRVVGSIDFKNSHARSGQIDYALEREYWNRGYMSEAACALRDWVFKNLPDLVRLQSYCIVENKGSVRIMEKMGMKHEGLRRKCMMVKGQVVDLAYYAIVK